MKKVTLFISLFMLVFSVKSQILNQPANWPNANWTITGSYETNISAFESDPTTTSNFAFDDDDAGPGHDDDIAAESPFISLLAAVSGGEPEIYVTVDYTFNLLEESLSLEYWDADASAWVFWQAFTETDGVIQDDFCSGVRATFTSTLLDASTFTPNQRLGFRYRFSYLDDGGAGGAAYEWGFCFDSPTLQSNPTLSVNDVENPLGFTYYPSPVDNVFTVNAQNKISNITVYNLLGQNVLSRSPNTLKSTIDMSGLNPGAYIIKVSTDNNVETIKIIKR